MFSQYSFWMRKSCHLMTFLMTTWEPEVDSQRKKETKNSAPQWPNLLILGGHILSTAVSIYCLLHNGANSRTAFKILWFIFWFRIRILLNLLCDLRSEFLLHTKFVGSGQNPPFYDSAHIEIFSKFALSTSSFRNKVTFILFFANSNYKSIRIGNLLFIEKYQ